MAKTERRQVKSPIAPSLPHSLDAERAVLGGVLLNNNAINAAIENLPPEDFFLDLYRRVFTQMTALAERDRRLLELVILTDELQRGDLEPSYAYQSESIDKCSNARNRNPCRSPPGSSPAA